MAGVEGLRATGQPFTYGLAAGAVSAEQSRPGVAATVPVGGQLEERLDGAAGAEGDAVQRSAVGRAQIGAAQAGLVAVEAEAAVSRLVRVVLIGPAEGVGPAAGDGRLGEVVATAGVVGDPDGVLDGPRRPGRPGRSASRPPYRGSPAARRAGPAAVRCGAVGANPAKRCSKSIGTLKQSWEPVRSISPRSSSVRWSSDRTFTGWTATMHEFI